ncbi:hypothetical protein SDJN02_03899, partial [Cucurbita argyrosperma subsp. argyrosperma]
MNGFNYAGELLRNLCLLLFSSGGGAVLRCGEDWAGKEASLKLNNAADVAMPHLFAHLDASSVASKAKHLTPRSPTNLAIF